MTGHAKPLLSIRNLRVRFNTPDGRVFAVNGVDLSVERGQTLGLVGESGCGKSVTALATMGLLPGPPVSEVDGEIVFDGRDLHDLDERSMERIRGRDIAMVFQDPMTSLNPVLRIGDQIEETIRAHRPVRKDAARRRAEELLGLVGIPDPRLHLRRYPHEFSGGMRQRVMIAIALALEPKLLIADEPTTALDVTVQAQVLELLARLTAERDTALIIITHDLGVVARMTRRTAVMYGGLIVEEAPTPQLFRRPLHPYTVGLLHSIARLDTPLEEWLRPIEGAPPHLLQAPSGCPFVPRCAWRLGRCEQVVPPLEAKPGLDASPDQFAACFNPVAADEVRDGRPRPARNGGAAPMGSRGA